MSDLAFFIILYWTHFLAACVGFSLAALLHAAKGN